VESTLSQLQRQTPKIQPKTTEEEQKKKKKTTYPQINKTTSHIYQHSHGRKKSTSQKKKETLKDIKRTTTKKPNA